MLFRIDIGDGVWYNGNMKIFNNMEPWTEKVNFVDENNVVLGYDMGHQCCESFGWFIADRVVSNMKDHASLDQTFDDDDYTDWRFDPQFFQIGESHESYDLESMAIFRIVNQTTGESRYIHLYNMHNGYYSHGFTFTQSNTSIRHGSL